MTLTLYSAIICPYAHRARIALKEVGVEHEIVEIDLSNKPEW
jgi:glutathione S-transferase